MTRIENHAAFGATYSTDTANFGEIISVFPVPADWQGFRHHGYCWASDDEIIAAGYALPDTAEA